MKRVFIFLFFVFLFFAALECEGQSFHSKRYNTKQWHKAVSFCITGPRYNPSDPGKSVMERYRRPFWIRRKR